ncbi:MAG: bifunctional 5,10-methylenetetrahydrofolate dehydrogenase/5,10-methenyltetrahydrofolate cyclohydrolase [Eubacteriales bacterium]|nr:bifunctional 5,10-methylenetetrahydrofolate dehydrogenase/5,10-methenyltetrahydrofolate cyclohydrolase [Eubacteriales bacterium]
MTKILKGKPASDRLSEELLRRSDVLRGKDVIPTLAVVRMGERPDDLAYERGLTKRAEKTGVEVRRFLFPENIPETEFLPEFQKIADDPSVHGILPFRPLPRQIRDEKIREILPGSKDVDGITAASMAAIYEDGRGHSDSGFAPCTAESVMELLDFYGINPDGMRAAVVGRSLVIGKPVSALLLQKNATVTVCHSHTKNLSDILQNNDILVLCAGHAGIADRSSFRKGQIVIDVSVNFGEDGKMRGDAVFEDADGVVSAITPVPGGVGSLTTSILMRHVIEAAERTIQ